MWNSLRDRGAAADSIAEAVEDTAQCMAAMEIAVSADSGEARVAEIQKEEETGEAAEEEEGKTFYLSFLLIFL